MADSNATFPTTPVALNYDGVDDKSTYGRRTADYLKIVAEIEGAQAIFTAQLERAQGEMNAHFTILQGAVNAAQELIAEAVTHNILPEGVDPPIEDAITELKSLSYIYDAGSLRQSIFFPYDVGTDRYSGEPVPHPNITLIAGPVPTILDENEQPIPDPDYVAPTPEQIDEYNQQLTAIIAEYNLMIPILLNIPEGSVIRTYVAQRSLDQLAANLQHAQFSQSLSDATGATSEAVELPVMASSQDLANLWQEGIDPDLL